ncbi:hypothetical protein BS47DRAFT_1423201 [Hydnum rufescens UP504]|uniref:NUC153 domain-containing protein n=1 Tax=Hydnum rufescens UP504 TaxID=1448309 RepID=A0A9P6B6J3_9AGAM|nr:hypothetical protein BS47DRAFT_1423201 [Hydnum rufescens UP504]
MADPRFARLRTDPRFRKPKSSHNKIVIDERFKSIFDDDSSEFKGKRRAQIDKYGRKLSKTHNRDRLKRFYRLKVGDEEKSTEEPPAVPDYARGEVLLESSDEEDHQSHIDSDGDVDNPVTLGASIPNQRRPESPPSDAEPGVDLDEETYDALDRQAIAYSSKFADQDGARQKLSGKETTRIAVVNLDWDHVRAFHLFKIFNSIASQGASGSNSGSGRVLNVRVYPSEFGKERMSREEREGPPPEIFRKKKDEDLDEEDINEQTIFEQGDGNAQYDDNALRKYQLERLRYYYAIVAFDSVPTASHTYNELDGTELERSANLFDLSFVPEGMEFGEDFRDECKDDSGLNKGLDFTTDALRHSKVKLTWDDDDVERTQITRRTLTRQQIEENDFKAYIASSGSSDSGSGSEVDDPVHTNTIVGASSRRTSTKQTRDERRAKLRSLLSGNNDGLPEGWGGVDVPSGDIEVTFAPGLTNSTPQAGDGEEETTLERYKRRQKEKKVARKAIQEARAESTGKKAEATAETDKSNVKKKAQKAEYADKEDEDDDHFTADVTDSRFQALHEDPDFAIDPSHPQFKATKSMAAFLQERTRRQKETRFTASKETARSGTYDAADSGDVQSLIESVKRKSQGSAVQGQMVNKRRKW